MSAEGKSNTYQNFLAQSEHDFQNLILNSFSIPDDQTLKDLLGL